MEALGVDARRKETEIVAFRKKIEQSLKNCMPDHLKK
jgi:hypothetical protein